MACLEAIREMDAAVPVIIASGQSPDWQTQTVLDRLAQGFVGKPYELKVMLQAVRETLDRTRVRG